MVRAQQLSPRQRRALANASPLARPQLLALFSQQSKPARGAPAPKRAASNQLLARRRLALPGLQAARIPRPFNLSYAFDGFDHRHLPLDEVTAPYACTNFVSTMEFSSAVAMDQVLVVCPRVSMVQEYYSGPLTDFIAMLYDASETIDGSIPTLQRLRTPVVGRPARPPSGEGNLFTSVRARLHNLSVKLECLGTNTGLYPPGSAYIGCVPTIETGLLSAGSEQGLTIKDAWATDSIEVGYLRSIPAASLVDRPVQLNAAVAENVSFKSWRDVVVSPQGSDAGSLSFSTALEPIVIYVPRCGEGTTAVQYRVVIGQQWCSRHPHNVMMRATQKQHPASSPGVWHTAVSAIRDIGPKILARAADGALDMLAGNVQRITHPQLALADASPLLVD